MVNYLRYANAGATRNQPLDPALVQALAFLDDMGVTAEVFSGGQPGKGSGLARVGSVRHDHGKAGDMRFYRGDKPLSWSNPQDVPVFQDIVKRGKQAGITGFGAGPGYMSDGSMHVGFGAPGVWGAKGKSVNAPDWLKQAFGSAMGQNTAIGGAGADTFPNAPAAPAVSPYASMADGPKGQESFRQVVPGSMAPFGPEMAGAQAPEMAGGSIPDDVGFLLGEKSGKPTFGDRLGQTFKNLAEVGEGPPPPRPSAFPGGPTDAQATALMRMMDNPQALAQMYLKRRMGA